ncbi:MAG: tetratricopeptide repeat protein, partial [Cyclobacteriaceae bacterium]
MTPLIDPYGNQLKPREPRKNWWHKFVIWYKRNPIIKTLIGLFPLLAFFGVKNIDDIQALITPTIFQEGFLEKQESSFNILLLPFQPLESCTFQNTHLERAIQTRLLEMSEKKDLGLQVIFDTTQSCPRNFTDAKEIGQRKKADLVIWGDLYERCNINNQACLKYVVIKKDSSRATEQGSSEIESIMNLADVMKGQLQRDIDYIIYWTLGLEASLQGECEKAKIYFENIFDKYSEKASQSYLHLGLCLEILGNTDYQSAVYYLSKAIELNPESADAYNNRGIAKFRTGDIDGAIADYDKAIELNPDEILTYRNRANLRDEGGNSVGAIADINKILQLDPEYSWAYLKRGIVKGAQGKHMAAFNDFNKAIDLNPKYVEVYNSRGNA